MANSNGGVVGVDNPPVEGSITITTFNSSGTLTTAPYTTTLTYLVIAGGASGGGQAQYCGGGGGAGGYRTGPTPVSGGSPYPITVGAGGAAVPNPVGTNGSAGSDSVMGTPTPITSAGGGAGAYYGNGVAGGSGGGAGSGPPGSQTGGAGNTPPVSPSQGNAGGAADGSGRAGGGGGAGAVGESFGGGSGCTSDGGAGSFIAEKYERYFGDGKIGEKELLNEKAQTQITTQLEYYTKALKNLKSSDSKKEPTEQEILMEARKLYIDDLTVKKYKENTIENIIKAKNSDGKYGLGMPEEQKELSEMYDMLNSKMEKASSELTVTSKNAANNIELINKKNKTQGGNLILMLLMMEDIFH